MPQQYSYGVFGRALIGAIILGPAILLLLSVIFALRADHLFLTTVIDLFIFLLVLPALYFLYPVKFTMDEQRLQVHYLLGGRCVFQISNAIIHEGLGGGLKITIHSGNWVARLLGSFRVATVLLRGGEEFLEALKEKIASGGRHQSYET